MTPPIITTTDLAKSFRTSAAKPGFLNNLKHFFNRQYKTIEAVKPLSFSINPGELVGFLGPNGAGKTTTLKMLSGLIHPSAGSVDVAGQRPFRRHASFLKQITLVMGNKQQLLWDLPATETFRINGAVYEIPPAQLKARVEQLTKMLDIEKQLTQPVRKLSLGERMKCELCASLLHQPSVLFLDEPTLGLDINAQTTVRQFLRDYNQQFNATILLTSHYMADITALCKRVLLIHQGRLFYDGPLTGILDRFAPYREVKLDLSQPIDKETLARFGEVASNQGLSASLTVRRENLRTVVEQLLTQLPIADLTISDPPIEKIIGDLFTSGTVHAKEPKEELGIGN